MIITSSICSDALDYGFKMWTSIHVLLLFAIRQSRRKKSNENNALSGHNTSGVPQHRVVFLLTVLFLREFVSRHCLAILCAVRLDNSVGGLGLQDQRAWGTFFLLLRFCFWRWLRIVYDDFAFVPWFLFTIEEGLRRIFMLFMFFVLVCILRFFVGLVYCYRLWFRLACVSICEI